MELIKFIMDSCAVCLKCLNTKKKAEWDLGKPLYLPRPPGKNLLSCETFFQAYLFALLTLYSVFQVVYSALPIV